VHILQQLQTRCQHRRSYQRTTGSGKNAVFIVIVVSRHWHSFYCYLPHRLASGEGIVTLGICVCVRRAATARRISLGGECNALYPVLSIVNILVGILCSCRLAGIT